ncbi:hypothetical protein OGAPHI_005041 [Ogataea philodendri]|uniref:GDP-mannose transporter n=1 Tax=Ogataea philodendri TaxID=1378263 RepID=A0A9P8P1Y3_9ASCO|nr:uncharacterized protein OGAPHI_005041 [Ogataea philodendri]KAH3663640.1 hypothetical protein OGAPHI_005041 [Ogataea philodendri]
MDSDLRMSRERSTSVSTAEVVPTSIDVRKQRTSLKIVTPSKNSEEQLIDSSFSEGHSNAHRRSHSYASPLHLRTQQGLESPRVSPDPLGDTLSPSATNMNSTQSTSSSRINPFGSLSPSGTRIPDVPSPESFWYEIKKTYPHLKITLLSIFSWYCFSLGISLYNRWMFSNKNLNFSFPIIITSFHQLILFLLSLLTLAMIPRFRLNYQPYSRSLPEAEHLVGEPDNGNSSDEFNDLLESKKVQGQSYLMPVKEYLTKILPCSIASAGDIGLGNTAFRFISLSLYTMIKTSSLIFVLFWGVVFKLEKMTWRILSIVLIMTFGVILMISGQHEDDSKPAPAPTPAPESSAVGGIVPEDEDLVPALAKRLFSREMKTTHLLILGSFLVLGSSCMSGLRWALTQIMLKKNPRTTNPILTILYLSPAMSFVLLIIGCLVEGIKSFTESPIWEEKGFFMTCLLILIPGLLAFFMTLSEFVLLQYASLLTLSIAGIFKELLTIFTSWLLFDDKLSFVNLIGLAITITDIVWYNLYRFDQMQAEGLPKNKVSRPTSFEDEQPARSNGDIELDELQC